MWLDIKARKAVFYPRMCMRFVFTTLIIFFIELTPYVIAKCPLKTDAYAYIHTLVCTSTYDSIGDTIEDDII